MAKITFSTSIFRYPLSENEAFIVDFLRLESLPSPSRKRKLHWEGELYCLLSCFVENTHRGSSYNVGPALPFPFSVVLVESELVVTTAIDVSLYNESAR